MVEVPEDLNLDEDSKHGSKTDFELVSDLAQQQLTLEECIAKGEAYLKELKEQHGKICRDLLPSAMDQVGISKFVLVDGSEITIKPVLTANIPAESSIERAEGEDREALIERRIEALAWLETNGGSPLIKREYRLSIPKGDEKAAKKIEDLLKKSGVEHQQRVAVHPGSLSKLIREKLQGSQEVPLETFNVFMGKESKIKLAKK